MANKTYTLHCTALEDTPILLESEIDSHPYLANTPPEIRALSLLVKHYERLTGQTLFIQQLTPETGVVWQYGQELPIHRYYRVESAIARFEEAIRVIEIAQSGLSNCAVIDGPDWIEELEAGDRGW